MHIQTYLQATASELFTFSLPGAGNGDRVASLAVFPELDAFIFGTMKGTLFSMDISTGQVEEVGELDSAVLVLEVSPDSQMIALVTAAGKLLLMNQQWEVEGETPLQMAVDNQVPVVLEQTVQLLEDSIALSWRGDCLAFCTLSQAVDEYALYTAYAQPILSMGINFISKRCCRPSATLRVWNPIDCTLEHCGDASSDESQALEPVAAWRPNGRYIFCSQAMGKHRRICLFERNGLGHGSFTVKLDSLFEIHQACWSPDSSILAIGASCEVRFPCLRLCRLSKACPL